MRAHGLAAVTAAAIFVTASAAQATPLNLSSDTPDIGVSTDVSYVAAAGTFTAVGDAVTIDFDGGGFDQFIAGSPDNFSLTASIDSSGNFAGGGFTITGSTGGPFGSFGPGTLLTGTLTAFGEGGSGTPFEFLFTPTGGDLADTAGDPFAFSVGGIIMGSLGWGGSFASDFALQSQVTDVFMTTVSVAEPATMLLLAPALMAVAGVTRRRRQG